MVLNIQCYIAHYRTKAHSQCCVLWGKRSCLVKVREIDLCSDMAWKNFMLRLAGWRKEMIFVFCFRIKIFYKKVLNIKFCFINIYTQLEFWITHIQNMTNDLWIIPNTKQEINYTNCSEKYLRINIPWGIFLLRIFILRYDFTRKMTFIMS